MASRIDTTRPHPARRYNYWLGGKDNFAADRASGDAIAAKFPGIRIGAQENRKFLRRAVTHLASEAGIEQFLDIGTGLPTADNTHEVAQRTAPQSKVVYVDNDPLVMVHARALLTSAEVGVTDYVEADLREPDKIMLEAARTLDFSQPVALMLVAVLHFIGDDDDPYGIVARLVDGLAPGSYLVISHATDEHLPEAVKAAFANMPDRPSFRDHEQVTRFFSGLQLVPPGVVSSVEWRVENEPGPRASVEDVATHCGVARKP
ncbi:MAG TPA: SAM-dependent methyltransferase [Micromonosporaceae bacterium]|nr:SAM-dependent methyltransferase [Micromonosporaceae bacterium]